MHLAKACAYFVVKRLTCLRYFTVCPHCARKISGSLLQLVPQTYRKIVMRLMTSLSTPISSSLKLCVREQIDGPCHAPPHPSRISFIHVQRAELLYSPFQGGDGYAETGTGCPAASCPPGGQHLLKLSRQFCGPKPASRGVETY